MKQTKKLENKRHKKNNVTNNKNKNKNIIKNNLKIIINELKIFALGLFALCILQSSYLILNAFFQINSHTLYGNVDLNIITSPAYLISVPITVVVEELLFRYLIIKKFGKFSSQSVLISAVLFGILHLDIKVMLFYFIAGLILGYAYQKTEKLKIPIMLHLTNNLAIIAVSVMINI